MKYEYRKVIQFAKMKTVLHGGGCAIMIDRDWSDFILFRMKYL